MFHDHKIILITGACGFIGSALTRRILNNELNIKKLVLIDSLTYAHDPNSYAEFINHPKVEFYKSDISSENEIFEIVNKTCPTLIFNFAAESHVDNSIDSPSEFMQTNISGTFSLLESIRKFNKANSQNITFFSYFN